MEVPVEGNSQTGMGLQPLEDYAQLQERDQELRRNHDAEEVRRRGDGQDKEQPQVDSEYHGGQDGVEQVNQIHEQSQGVVDTFSSFVVERLYDLPRMTSTQFGLLDELSGNNVLTLDQIDSIRRKGKKIGEAKQL